MNAQGLPPSSSALEHMESVFCREVKKVFQSRIRMVSPPSGVRCMAHKSISGPPKPFQLLLISKSKGCHCGMEWLLKHNPKRHLEITRLAEIMETKAHDAWPCSSHPNTGGMQQDDEFCTRQGGVCL